jgi:hypothetical protein
MYQAQIQRHDDGNPARSHTELSADVTKVVINTGLGAAADLADLPGRLASGAPLQDFFFSGCKFYRRRFFALLRLETDLGWR